MANLLDFYFEQLVTEGDMDQLQANLEFADHRIMADQGYEGIVQNFGVVEHNPTPDLTVDIAGPGIAYDQEGQRINMPTSQTLDVSVDSNSNSTAVVGGGNEKWVSVFVRFTRNESDLRFDGNGVPVFFSQAESFEFVVVQGAEAAAGTAVRPSLLSDGLLIADILLDFGKTQIFDADIESEDVVTDPTSRFQFIFNLTASAPAEVRVGPLPDAMQAVLTELNNHIADLSNAHDADTIGFDPLSLPIPAAWSALAAASNVQEAIDAIVDDLTQFTATSGAGLVGFDPSTSDFVNATVQQVLANEVGPLAGNNAWTGQNDFDDARLTDESSLTDDGADDDAARETPIIDTPTTTVGSNLDKKLIYQIGDGASRFFRIYVTGNGWNFTFNAAWDHASNTWLRDAGTASSYRWRLGTAGVPFIYEERTSGESDGWSDSAWVIAGREAGFLLGSGDQLEINDGGITVAVGADVVDAWSRTRGHNESAGQITAAEDINLPIEFPAAPSTVNVTVIDSGGLAATPVAPNTGSNDRNERGITISATVNSGPTAYRWSVEADVS